ncbi:MAG: hypothetical protein ACI8X5_002634 [Planctomycetota bacterium]|jgi:hypothetical protein
MNLILCAATATLLCLPLIAQDGLTLHHPFGSTDTVLIDSTGMTVHSWLGTAGPALSVYLLPDGDLLRSRNPFGASGGGGVGFERVTYDGTVEWQFTLATSTLTPHHDMLMLPNGNVLMVIWEEVGGSVALAEGRDPSTLGGSFKPDILYEIAETGPTSGSIIWEWHAFDHLVQDFDNSLPNFGVIADHPERIDINYGPSGDWMHTNAIDYHPEFDQIAISVPNFDEVWIIDHSTSSAEAAGSTGGNSGKGGDLLYRFGNPEAYDRGTAADRVFYFLHDVQWVKPGRPGAGNMTVFNNGRSRPTGDWSSADEWVPPVDAFGNYTIGAGVAYGPTALLWTYSDIGNFFTNIMGGVERLENGNTLICEATSSRLFEVTDGGATAWNHVNTLGSPSWIFKARRYPDCNTNRVPDSQDIASGAEDDLNDNGVLDGCESPTNYCDAAPNSTGLAASMGWFGSTSILSNDLDLLVGDCPANVSGIFAYGPNQGSMPAGDGSLCLSAPFVRISPPTQTDASGLAMHSFDNQNLPMTSPILTAGTTLNFTFWYRDPAGGPAGFNFSDGLSVLFVN